MMNVGECKIPVNVWTSENRVSSGGEVKEVCLDGLPEGAMELFGLLAAVDGKTKLGGVFKYAPYLPQSKVTADGFDQVLLYHNLSAVQKYLMGLGFNIPAVLGTKHDGKTHPIAAHANATAALNAWYSPQSDDLTFGTAGDKWHLASDNDISAHEAAHLILDHYNPDLTGWYSGDGGAIHEGYADALAALVFNDPELSEDFVPFKNKPENKDDGLRTVANDLTLYDVSDEEHDKGQVYGGFFWAIKKAISDPNGPFKVPERMAADIVLRMLVNHGANYTTKRPSPADFVDAVIKGMEGLAQEGRLGFDPTVMKEIIIAEARRRKMFDFRGEPLPPDMHYFASIDAAVRHFSGAGYDIGFYKSHQTRFVGGVAESYQEQAMTRRFGVVDVIGKGIVVKRNKWGNVVSVSTRDVLPIKAGQIDESGTVELATAVRLASLHASSEYRMADISLRNWRPPQKIDAVAKKFAELQMDIIIARSDLANLQRLAGDLSNGSGIRYKMVLLPGNPAPQYELKVGMSIYYVDTKTGAVTRQKDVIVN